MQTPGRNKHAAGVKSMVVSTAPCVLRRATATNDSDAAMWLMVFDLAALPVNGTAPDRTPIPIAAGSINGDDWAAAGGTQFVNGCVVALSSTVATLTLIATDEGFFDSEIVA